MAWGEVAAEQHEKDAPSEPRTCLRPDGASPELPPLKDRDDFADRIQAVLPAIRFHQNSQMRTSVDKEVSYHAERERAAQAKADQLVLMRATQIMEEAEERRRNVMAKLAKSAHVCESWQTMESAKGGQYCGACGAAV